MANRTLLRIAPIALAVTLMSARGGQTAMELGQNVHDFYQEVPGLVPFLPNVNFATTANPWKPQWLADLKVFRCIRFLDWQNTIVCQQTQWTTRRAKTNPDQQSRWEYEQGTAYEWWIDLCNRTQSDPWICLPYKTVSRAHASASVLPDYALRFAILLKTGVDMKAIDLSPLMGRLSSMTAADFVAAGGSKTCDGLRSDLHVYVEYANETWNYFWDWVDGEAQAMGLANGGAAFTGLAGVRVAEAFYKVYGYDSDRVRPVLCGQTENLWHCAKQLEVAKSSVHNPNKVRIWGIGIAPYLQCNPNSIANLRAHIPKALEGARNHRKLADANNVRLCAYEAGQHQLTAGCATDNSNPAMYDLYKEYLAAMDTVFNGMFVHFGYVGGWNSFGCWGSKTSVDQPLSEAHKFRALYEWALAHNPQPAAVGVSAPAGRPAEASAAARAAGRPCTLEGRRVAGPVGNGVRVVIGRDGSVVKECRTSR